MKETTKSKLKLRISIIYAVISILILVFSKLINKLWLYLGVSFLGLSLRAFYFSLISRADPDLLAEDKVNKCIGDYFIYYPIMMLAILSSGYLFFIKKFIEDSLLNTLAMLCICLYIGFDIYSIATRLLKIDLEK